MNRTINVPAPMAIKDPLSPNAPNGNLDSPQHGKKHLATLKRKMQILITSSWKVASMLSPIYPKTFQSCNCLISLLHIVVGAFPL